jgi:hypothetical protein
MVCECGPTTIDDGLAKTATADAFVTGSRIKA